MPSGRRVPKTGAAMTSKRIFLIAAIVVLALAGGVSMLSLARHDTATPQQTATGERIGGPFTLVAADGHTVTDHSYRGKWMLVYFGYTFCPDVCPTTLNNIAQALIKLGPSATAIVPLFITVDPKRDTPTVIGDYVNAFDPRIVGLSGSETQVAAVAKAYHVYYAIQPGGGSDDYLVDHSSFLYLMTPQGVFAKVLPGSLSGGEMADAIKPFLASAS
jgi:protein SCO1/2